MSECVVCKSPRQSEVCATCGFRHRVVIDEVAKAAYSQEIRIARDRWEEHKAAQARITELEAKLSTQQSGKRKREEAKEQNDTADDATFVVDLFDEARDEDVARRVENAAKNRGCEREEAWSPSEIRPKNARKRVTFAESFGSRMGILAADITWASRRMSRLRTLFGLAVIGYLGYLGWLWISGPSNRILVLRIVLGTVACLLGPLVAGRSIAGEWNMMAIIFACVIAAMVVFGSYVAGALVGVGLSLSEDACVTLGWKVAASFSAVFAAGYWVYDHR